MLESWRLTLLLFLFFDQHALLSREIEMCSFYSGHDASIHLI